MSARTDPAGAAAAGFRVFLRAYPAMLAAWLVPGLVHVGANLASWAFTRGAGLDPDALPGSATEAMAYLGTSVPLFLVTLVAALAGWGLVARAVAHRLDADAHVPAVPWRALVTLAAVLLMLYLAGLALVLVGFVVFLHWYAFAPAALAQDPSLGVGGAMEASRRFARERRTHGFTALLVLVLVGAAVLVVMEAATLTRAFTLAGVPPGIAEALADAGAGWLTWPLLPALPAAYWALAKAESPVPVASVVAPAPPAAPRATKCPQCGTLISYAPTGRPVDVACPSCGRAGRVL